MHRQEKRLVSLFALGWMLLHACTSSAQVATSSGFAGTVKDATGAVLPGVTVEAASPALIERVRTVVTDEQGTYRILDLRSGTYSLTFTLPGFATVRHEGIELSANFTATINAELKVGSVEETVTVSGETPVVDVQNAAARELIPRAVFDTVPSARGSGAIIAMTPGIIPDIPTNQDVGGSRGEQSVRSTIHGGSINDHRQMFDSIDINMPHGSNNLRQFQPISEEAEEISVELGGGNAEAEVGGIMVNYIPKSGSNSYKGNFLYNYTNNSFQSLNLTPSLQAQGLTAANINKVNYIWDVSGSMGGPIVKDKLWFFTAQRRWDSSNSIAAGFFNKSPNPLFYVPDTNRPDTNDFWNRAHHGNVTWQLSPRNKIRGSYDHQLRCDCHRNASSTVAPEAANYQTYPADVTMVTWNFPATNKLLFEAGTARLVYYYTQGREPEAASGAISILDTGLNLRYGSNLLYQEWHNWTQNTRFSMSYVTGRHAVKVGMTLRHVREFDVQSTNGDINYTFQTLNGITKPLSLTLYADPIEWREHVDGDLGLYAQDQWTMNRLTVNYGVRFDHISSSVDPNQVGAGQFVSARTFSAVSCVPCFTDLSPRLSVAYDLFGTGKTALKANVARYVGGESLNTTIAADPMTTSVTSVIRAWHDDNGDFVPNCDLRNPAANGECGPFLNFNFGKNNPLATKYASDVLSGLGNRTYNWQYSTSVQQELWPGVAVNVGYFRTTWGNFQVTDNQSVKPSDYDPYCLTVPVEPLLPGGGGNPLCGLYDLNPVKVGQVNNVVTQASHYGVQTQVYNGIDITLSGRLPKGMFVGGGMNTGRMETNDCFVVNSPQQLLFCDVKPPFWEPQVKLFGSYRLPWDVQASVTFQSLQGIPKIASYVAQNSQVAPSLGRNLSGGLTTVMIPYLFAPNSQFMDRINQLDVRFQKNVNVGRLRLIPKFDIYNVLNASAPLAIRTQYGANWLQPAQILDGRLGKFEIQIQF
jgi:hypothetical protein